MKEKTNEKTGKRSVKVDESLKNVGSPNDSEET